VVQADDPAGAVAAVARHAAVGVRQRGAQPVEVVGPGDDPVAAPALDEPAGGVAAQLDRFGSTPGASERGVG